MTMRTKRFSVRIGAGAASGVLQTTFFVFSSICAGCAQIPGAIPSLFDCGVVYLPEALADGWQTGTSKESPGWQFNLWNGYGQEQPEDERVSAAFLPDEIFCCGFQSCFFEAVRLRFPEYADAASSLPCMGPG